MRKIYSAIVLSAAIAMSVTGCATPRDGNVKTNQYNAKSLNPNGYTDLGTNAKPNANGMRTHALNDYNNNYGTNRTYSGTGANRGNTGMYDRGANVQDRGTNGHGISSNYGPNHNGVTHAYNKTVSQKIENHVSSIKGVKNATVVVYGNDAIVGLDVGGNTDMSKLTNKVEKAVHDVEPGYNVHVTSDTSVLARLRSLNTNLVAPLNGHPAHNFSNDVSTLIYDIGHVVRAPFR